MKIEKALNDRLQQTIDSQALQISKLKLEVERLQGELDAANSRPVAVISDASERESSVAASPPSPPPPQKKPPPPVVTAREKRSSSPSPSPHQPLSITSDTDLRPVSALSEEDIQIHENGVSEDESEKDDEAFDKSIPSPVAPCPYIDFVPLDKEKAGKEKRSKEKRGSVKRAGSAKKGEEPVKEGAVEEGVEPVKEEVDAEKEVEETVVVDDEGESPSAGSEEKPLPKENEDVKDQEEG